MRKQRLWKGRRGCKSGRREKLGCDAAPTKPLAVAATGEQSHPGAGVEWSGGEPGLHVSVTECACPGSGGGRPPHS